MPIERSKEPVDAERIQALASRLLQASSLCAIATVSPGGRAHVNTAYFAVESDFDLVWLSDPEAGHSRNLRVATTTAIAVYDSNQSWGKADRGIQLFGSAREVRGRSIPAAARAYARRFAEFEGSSGGYRLYRFRPRRIKIFDERALGAGVFVTAIVHGPGLSWARTDVYRSA